MPGAIFMTEPPTRQVNELAWHHLPSHLWKYYWPNVGTTSATQTDHE